MALSRDGKVYLLVVTVTVSAASVSAAGYLARPAFPGWWPVATFLFVATLLEGVNTRLFRKVHGHWLITMNHVSAYDVAPTSSAPEAR